MSARPTASPKACRYGSQQAEVSAGGLRLAAAHEVHPAAVEDGCRPCIGSGHSGSAGAPAAVIILLESLETGADDKLLLDATAGLVGHLSPNDLMGVTDGSEGLVVPLQRIDDGKSVTKRIRSVVGIGDPGSYDPYARLAWTALAGRSEVKQVILIGDGDASPPSPETMSLLRGAGVRLSTIGVDPDPNAVSAMQAVAQQGGGTFQLSKGGHDAPAKLLASTC